MRRFLLRLSIFVLIPFLFIILLESAIFSLKDDIFSEETIEKNYINISNDYQWVNKIKSDRKIFLVGSSSVKYGLSCSILNKFSNDTVSFINLAMPAGGPIEMYFLLKQLDLSGLKAVYFGLDPWIFSKFIYRLKIPYIYLDMNLLQATWHSFYLDRPIVIQRYFAFFHYLFQTKRINHDINQKIPADFGSETLVRKPKNFNFPINFWFQIERYGWSQLQFDYLKKIADLCKNKNIEFCTFVPPKRSDFSKTYKLKCRLDHKEFINNLIKLNFRPAIFGKFDQLDSLGEDTLFAESFHLNREGQKVYSGIFYQMTLKKKMIFSSNYSWFIAN